MKNHKLLAAGYLFVCLFVCSFIYLARIVVGRLLEVSCGMKLRKVKKQD